MAAKRRAKGAGSVCQRPDGRWVATVELTERRTPGQPRNQRKRRVFYGWTPEEAEAKMRAAFPDLLPPDHVHSPSRQRRHDDMESARLLGTHTAREWWALIKATDYTCHYCGKRTRYMTKDHRIPVSRGGSDAIDNIVPACKPCNSSKSNMTEAEYLEFFGRVA